MEAQGPAKDGLEARSVSLISGYASLAGFSFLGIINFQQSINYLKTALITNIATNISMYFTKMLLKFINLRVGVKELRKTRASES